MNLMHKVLLLIFLLACVSCETKQPTDRDLTLESRIIDNANILTRNEKDSIFSLIKKLDLQIGSQIAIITVDSLYGEKIEAFSINVTDSLGLGRSTYNDGILITIAFKDRMARIEVGTGLENIIKDEIAAEIIREELAPKFREGNYGQGLFLVVEEISNLIRNNRQRIGQKPE